MIEILNGLTETINYKNKLGLRLFHNVEYEDYPPHWHMGLEIIMPVSEQYTVLIENERYFLEEQDIFIINSGVLHGLEAPPSGERIILQFEPALLYSLNTMETLLSILPPVLYIPGDTELHSRIIDKMQRIVQEYDQGNIFCEAIVYSALIEMFGEVGRMLTSQKLFGAAIQKKRKNESQTEYLEMIMNACNYINLHYQENLKLEDIAAMAGFSKFHFMRIFKQYMNMTCYEYLSRKRVKCAEELLSSTELSVTDIAMNSGFSSMSAFDRTFKSINGCSPSEFRRCCQVN